MTETELRLIVKSICDIGAAWGKSRGYGEDMGIATFAELLADGVYEAFIEDGEVFWCLPGHRAQAANVLPA